MTISINYKKKEVSEIFESIEDFKKYIIENYKININKKESLIVSIFQKLNSADGNVSYSNLNRWISKEFNFKYKNIYQKEFWIERGFTEESYNDYIFKEKDRRSKVKKDMSYRKDYNKEYSDKFKFKYTYFISKTQPFCNLCNSELVFYQRYNKNEGKYFDIIGCSNDDCEGNKTRSNKIRWKAFLPIELSNSKTIKLENNMRDNNILNINYHISKGHSLDEAKQIISNIQSKNSNKVKNRFIVSKENLRKKGFTEEQINDICLTPSMLKFWLNKGFDMVESKKLVSENQKYASKHVDYEKRLLPSNIEYWLNRGFNLEESKLKVSESQRTFSKEICIQKWGVVEGLKRFNDRQNKWQRTLNENGNIKGGYSKISQELFDEISNIIKGNFKYATNGGEFSIRFNNHNYYYDFTDIDRYKIIEYNGDQYHANPRIYNDDEFPHPYRNKKGEDSNNIWQKDMFKEELAREKCFKYLIIWDSDYKKNKQEIVEKCINFILTE
jgi:hypothetical protein